MVCIDTTISESANESFTTLSFLSEYHDSIGIPLLTSNANVYGELSSKMVFDYTS